jgi:hypothetical protein
MTGCSCYWCSCCYHFTIQSATKLARRAPGSCQAVVPVATSQPALARSDTASDWSINTPAATAIEKLVFVGSGECLRSC